VAGNRECHKVTRRARTVSSRAPRHHRPECCPPMCALRCGASNGRACVRVRPAALRRRNQDSGCRFRVNTVEKLDSRLSVVDFGGLKRVHLSLTSAENGSLLKKNGGSAPHFSFSRPARRSLHVTARILSPQPTLCGVLLAGSCRLPRFLTAGSVHVCAPRAWRKL
jgi:hypothetical protein